MVKNESRLDFWRKLPLCKISDLENLEKNGKCKVSGKLTSVVGFDSLNVGVCLEGKVICTSLLESPDNLIFYVAASEAKDNKQNT